MPDGKENEYENENDESLMPLRRMVSSVLIRLTISESVVFLRAFEKARLASYSMSECATTRRVGIFRGWSRIMWQPIRAYPRNQRTNQFLRVLCGPL